MTNHFPEGVASLAIKLLECGNPSQDEKALRRCLGQYPTGVTVVTALHAGQRYGMAVNSFAAVSLDPPLVSWSIRKASKSLSGFTQATHFAVNVLSEKQLDVSRCFGVGAPDKFDLVPWSSGLGGAPLLHGALVHLECRQVHIYEGGDHLMLLGQVERYHRFEGAPLLFSQGAYGVVSPHPQQVLSQVAPSEVQPTHSRQPTLTV